MPQRLQENLLPLVYFLYTLATVKILILVSFILVSYMPSALFTLALDHSHSQGLKRAKVTDYFDSVTDSPPPVASDMTVGYLSLR